MPRLIWVFAWWHKSFCLVLSCSGSSSKQRFPLPYLGLNLGPLATEAYTLATELSHWLSWMYPQHVFMENCRAIADKTNKMTCPPSKDSDQPGHPPSLIRVFVVCLKKPWVHSYPLRMPSLIWVYTGCTGYYIGFVMLWLNYFIIIK